MTSPRGVIGVGTASAHARTVLTSRVRLTLCWQRCPPRGGGVGSGGHRRVDRICHGSRSRCVRVGPIEFTPMLQIHPFLALRSDLRSPLWHNNTNGNGECSVPVADWTRASFTQTMTMRRKPPKRCAWAVMYAMCVWNSRSIGGRRQVFGAGAPNANDAGCFVSVDVPRNRVSG